MTGFLWGLFRPTSFLVGLGFYLFVNPSDQILLWLSLSLVIFVSWTYADWVVSWRGPMLIGQCHICLFVLTSKSCVTLSLSIAKGLLFFHMRTSIIEFCVANVSFPTLVFSPLFLFKQFLLFSLSVNHVRNCSIKVGGRIHTHTKFIWRLIFFHMYGLVCLCACMCMWLLRLIVHSNAQLRYVTVRWVTW